MKVAVFGDDDFNNHTLIKTIVYRLPTSTEMVTGRINEIDRYAEKVALHCKLKIMVVKLDNINHGPLVVNEWHKWDIAKKSDLAIVFWSGRNSLIDREIRRFTRLGKKVVCFDDKGSKTKIAPR